MFAISSPDNPRIYSQRRTVRAPSLFYTRAGHNFSIPLFPSLSLSLPLSPSLYLSLPLYPSLYLLLSLPLSSLISPSLSISLLLPFFLSLSFISLLFIILFGVSNGRFRPCLFNICTYDFWIRQYPYN